MARQLSMLDPGPIRPRRIMMHVVDAGHHPCIPGKAAQFECAKCGHVSEWMPIDSVSDGKRGRPCPQCNKDNCP